MLLATNYQLLLMSSELLAPKKNLTYVWRWLIASGVYVFFKITSAPTSNEMFVLGPESAVYYVFTIMVFFALWEVFDLTVKRQSKRFGWNAFGKKPLLELFLVNLAISVPVVFFTSYMTNFFIADLLGCQYEDPSAMFFQDLIKGELVGIIFIALNTFRVFFLYSQYSEIRMAELQREAALAKYESLKDQVDPHFLFNSFSVLTSLIYQNRDLASDFIVQLSKTYRYILENREKELVTLEKELGFLDSFLFLMNIRHEGSLQVNKHLSIDTTAFMIPTLALQMLVDNALKHNSFSEEEPLCIDVLVQGNYLLVRNNVQKVAHQPVSTKVGLANIVKRYSFHTALPVEVRNDGRFFEVHLPLLQQLVQKPTPQKQWAS